MAPLGVLTAIAGAIRVGGASWLRRLIGRARETNANAEMEVMSSVSHEVCELWNGKSVVRTTGRPEIKQIINFPAEEGDISPNSFHTMETANEHNVLKERNTNAKITRSENALDKSAASPREESPDNDSGKRDNKDDIEARPIKNKARRTTMQNMPPNLSLNIHGGSDPIELWLYAAFATILQTAVLVWSGFVAYSPHARKNPQLTSIESTVGFPLQATGTVLLTWSLVLCAGIIDKATLERHWRREEKSHVRMMSRLFHFVNGKQFAADQHPKEKPFRREDMQLYWVQKQHTAGDNSFDPYILYTGEVTDEIRESHRAEEKDRSDQDDEFLVSQDPRPYKTTTFAVSIGVVGFLAQFQGLRFLNWTCSIAQLIALGTATILRAWARRRMTKTPVAVPVNNDYILDNLTLAIVGSGLRFPDPESLRSPGLFLAFGVTTTPELRARCNSEPKNQRQPGSEHSTQAELEPANSSFQHPINAQLPRDTNEEPSLAQRALNLRVRLGQLTEWTGPKSQEAVTLSNSIETTLERLSPRLPAAFGGKYAVVLRVDTYRTIPRAPATSMSDSQEEVHLHLNVDGDKWRVDDAQLEALLSLVSYSAWAAEQSKRNRGETDRGKRPARLDSSGHSIEAQSLENDRSIGWLRAKAPDSKLCHKVVGKSSPKLMCDLFWWIPNMDQVLNKAKYVGTCRESMVAVQVGFNPETDLTSKADFDKVIEHALGFYVSSEGSKESGKILVQLFIRRTLTCSDTFWSLECTEEHASVLHLFSTFLWATMKHVSAAQFHPTTVTSTRKLSGLVGTKSSLFDVGRYAEAVLLLPELKSDKVESIVLQLQSTGLSTAEEIYKVLIPLLSHFDKLPNEAVADWRHESLMKKEASGQWRAKRDRAIIKLLWLVQRREAQDRFAKRAAAVVIEFLIRVDDDPFFREPNDLNTYNKELRKFIDDDDNKTVAKTFQSLRHILARQGKDYIFRILQVESTLSAPKDNDFTFPNDANVFGWTKKYRAAVITGWISKESFCQVSDIAGQLVLHHLIDRTVGLRSFHPDVVSLATQIRRESENHEPLTARCDGQTLLHRAAKAGHLMIVDALLEKGVDPNAADTFLRTGLFLAAYYGHTTVVNKLCDAMSPEALNRKDSFSRNALYYAVLNPGVDAGIWKPKEVARSLQREGKVATLEDKEFAALALIERGVGCNAEGMYDGTVLWYAASGGMKNVIEVLRRIDRVDLTKLTHTREGFIPEQEAERAGQTEIAKMLRQWRLEKVQKETKRQGIRRYFKPVQQSREAIPISLPCQ